MSTWASYRDASGDAHSGVLVDGTVHAVRGDLVDLVERAEGDLDAWAPTAIREATDVVPIDKVDLLAPVPVPPSVRDFMAFESHVLACARAMGRVVEESWYDAPTFYFSNPRAVLGPADAVPVAPGSERFDYEVELAAVIGRRVADLDPATALNHVAGFTLMCDWSARDLQQSEMAHGLGPAKGKDTATTLGPWLVTPRELATAGAGFDVDVEIEASGQPLVRSSFRDMLWSFGQLLAYASRGTELVPGDVVGSGTVGAGCLLELTLTRPGQGFRWLQAGDRVRVRAGVLGELGCAVTAGSAPVVLGDNARRTELRPTAPGGSRNL